MTQKTQQVIIGIDVAKEKLDIYNLASKKHAVIENNARKIGQWLSRLKKDYTDIKFVLEPTGGYEKKLLSILLSHEEKAYYLHPNKLYNYKKCEGDKAKTDKIDGYYLAHYALDYENQLTRIGAEYIDNTRLSELTTARQQLLAELHRINCQLDHDYFSKEVKKSYKRRKKSLQSELEIIEKAITQTIDEDDDKKALRDRLKTVKGVGKVVSQLMVSEVPELGRLDRNKICKLIGVAPINQDSGKQKGKRSIRGGRGHVRSALYMAALVAIRFNPPLKKIYDDLRARGKLFKVAIVAIMRRLVCIMNAMARDKKPWQNSTDLAAQKA